MSLTVQNKYMLGHDQAGQYTGDWGVNSVVKGQAGRMDYLKRAGALMTAGTGYKREALLNSIGGLSKNQLQQKGFAGALNRVGWRATSVFSTYLALSEGGGVQDLGMQAGMLFGGNLGFRAGQNLGGAIFGGKTWKASLGRNLMGLGGGVGGAIVAGGAAYLAYDAAFNSNNIIARGASMASTADFKHKFGVSQGTLTARQRGLQQISKSALNNRGQLLGMEASVLNGF